MTEQEAADFVAWVRANQPSMKAMPRDFYAADGSFMARYVEIRGRHGRVQLWNSKQEFAAALQLWRQIFWATLFMVAIGGFLVGARNVPSIIAGLACMLVGIAGMVRMYLWRLWRHDAAARP
jgi:hypothetical protein